MPGNWALYTVLMGRRKHLRIDRKKAFYGENFHGTSFPVIEMGMACLKFH